MEHLTQSGWGLCVACAAFGLLASTFHDLTEGEKRLAGCALMVVGMLAFWFGSRTI